MKLIAAAPALVVLVSLCGSPVPEPPGTITGMVFHDANRNGIHDSCDSGLAGAQVVVSGHDGRAESGDDGVFRIQEVPPGDYQVSVVAAQGFTWPVTTSQSKTIAHVTAYQETDEIGIGVASRSAFATDSVSVSGVIFDDADGDGEIDKDECGIEGLPGEMADVSFVETAEDALEGRRGIPNQQGAYEIRGLPGVARVQFSLSNGEGLLPTIGDIGGAGPCSVAIDPKPRYGPNIYEANAGFTRARFTASISGTVFEDRNGNGRRDEGEAGVPDVPLYLYQDSSTCFSPYGQFGDVFTDAEGAFVVDGAAPGLWRADLVYGYVTTGDMILMPSSSFTPTVRVTQDGDAVLDIPVGLEVGGYVYVRSFDDANGDGLWSDGEEAVTRIGVCLVPDDGLSGSGRGKLYNPFACNEKGGELPLRLGPVSAGVYTLRVQGYIPTAAISLDAGPTVTVEAGREITVDYPLDILHAEEQVILPGEEVDRLALEVCFTDEAWVQPAFDDVYDPGLALIRDSGLDEQAAREMYEHLVYTGGKMQDFSTAVWQALAHPDALALDCTLEHPGGQSFVLSGYAPLEVLRDDAVVQVKVRPRGAGLYSVVLPPLPAPVGALEDPATQAFYLFVDESYRPLVRCWMYGPCERVD